MKELMLVICGNCGSRFDPESLLFKEEFCPECGYLARGDKESLI